MSNHIFTRIPSVMPSGNGVALGVSATGTTGGYVCAAAATKSAPAFVQGAVFGRQGIATDAEQLPGTHVWSPPT